MHRGIKQFYLFTDPLQPSPSQTLDLYIFPPDMWVGNIFPFIIVSWVEFLSSNALYFTCSSCQFVIFLSYETKSQELMVFSSSLSSPLDIYYTSYFILQMINQNLTEHKFEISTIFLYFLYVSFVLISITLTQGASFLLIIQEMSHYNEVIC